VLTDEGH